MSRRIQPGFTLLEVLVVIILTGLISTLLLQAIGFSMASFQRSRDFQRGYQKETLAFGWLRASLENMLASDVVEFTFEGETSEIRGFSLAPIFSASGSVVKVRWSIRTNGQTQDLWYEENDSQPMMVFSFPADGARFKYRSTSSAWLNQWNADQIPAGILPWRLKLEVDGGNSNISRDILMATKTRRIPRWDYRAFL